MNLSDLEVPPPQQVQRTSTEASDKDADFLSLRLLNKRTRVRLSPEPLDLQPLPGRGQLFSVANLKGWFVAAIRHAGSDISLIFSPLADLRLAFSNATPENAENVFAPHRTLSFAPATPNIITFASADTRLVVGLTQGPVLVFDTARLFTQGSDEITPLHSFPSTTSSAPREILPNPGDMPDLVAVLRDGNGQPGSQLVEIVDVQRLESIGGWRSGNAPDATPTSLSWSPKGKQIAVGLQSGDIITFSPSETGKPKLVYGRPPCANNQSIIATTWLSPPTIHTIYAPPGPLSPDAEQTHIILSVDKNKNTCSDIKLTTPYFPSPGIRPPGSFTVVLRNWEPAKFILLVGDSSSSDIGVMGSLNDDGWYNLSLEETSTPSLPLDKDMNDTVLIALELDLTSTETYRHIGTGEASELPPPPIMYAYASDGTLLGWYIVNSQGHAYSGMVSANAAIPSIIAPAMSSSISQRDMQMSTAPVTPVSELSGALGQQAASQSAFGQPSFGQSSFLQPQSAFGQPSTSSAFGQPSAFGQSPQTPSAFGQPSTFGQAASTSPFGQPSSSPAFGSNTTTGGFGAFSSAGSAKFGQSAFGFGTSPPPSQPATSPPPAPAEDSMAADDAPSFGGMSLGGPSDTKESPAFGSGSIFGQAALSPPPQSNDKPTSAFGPSGFGAIKPATGFGAFANLSSQPGAFGGATSQATPAADTPKPSSVFGKGGFEAKPSGGFGQSGFGQPAFGQSGFGQPSAFGKSSFGANGTTAAQPTSGGFSAFSSAASSFTTAASPVSGDAKPAQPTSGGFGAFAQSGPSSFAQAASSGGGNSKPSWASEGSQGAFGAMQSSSDTKSVFGDAGNSGALNPPAKAEENSTFGGGAGGANTFDGGSVFATGQSAFGNMEAKDESKDVDTPSTPKPSAVASALVSPPSSPGPTSVDNKSPPLGKNDNAPPSSSPFKSSLPASGTGAFGQLKTSSTGFFKPAEGFGAFGSSVSNDSPFYNPPKEVGTKPVSVFATSSGSFTPTSTPPKPSTTSVFGSPSVLGSSKPAFGSTSALGSTTKSAFASPSSVAPATPEPTSGGFSAFSSKSAFGVFAGAKASSFSELLRGGEEAKDPSKTANSAFGDLTEGDAKPLLPASSEKPETPSSVIFKDDATELGTSETQEKPEDVSPPLNREDATSATPTAARTSPVPTETKENKEKLEASTGQDRDRDAGEPPLSSSLSQSSSFVEISAPSDNEDPASRADIPDRPVDSGSDLEDDTQSFLSESFSSEDSDDEVSDDEEAASDEDEERSSSSEHPAEIPLPPTPQAKSRSPSATPKPEPLSAKGASSLSPSSAPSTLVTEDLSTAERPIRGGSTTPPGSPPQPESAALPEAPVQVPAAPTALGPDRPSTRPARSSPLASTASLAPSVHETHRSKSTPSLIPKPASPKQPFGFLGPEQSAKPPSSADPKPSQSKRPVTPPFGSTSVQLPSLTGHPLKSTSTPSLPSNVLGTPKFSSPSVPNLQDIGATPAPGTSHILSSTPSFFGKSTAPSPSIHSAPANLFGGSPLATPATNIADKKPMPPAAGLFGGIAPAVSSSTPAAAAGSLARQPTVESGSFVGAQGRAVTSPAVMSMSPAELQGQGMQAQCAFLFTHLNKELNTLQQHAQRIRAMRDELSKASGFSHHKETLTDPAHWTLGDITIWGQVLKTLQDDIEQLHENRIAISQSLRELESSMLRAGTKKEEIARFNKAKTDPEFAKMLKVRTLGPEHLETQSQLRRDIRAMRDRVQKLEDHLEASKKKLSQMRTGKPGLRPPSLDTINRTYRNIDIAVNYQAEQVALLTARLKKLKISSNKHSSHLSTRDSRLPDARRPYKPPQSVINSATNALNGEIAAHKLKHALPFVRRQPLLNTQAVTAPAPPIAFTTPKKPIVKAEPQTANLGFDMAPFPPSDAWKPAAFAESQLNESGPQRRSAKSSHASTIKLKRTPVSSPSPPSSTQSPPVSFDWGPLPVIAPKKGLPFGFAKSSSPSN
ncbi:hypothetical protein PILCRDRAFT_817577 [Piloderma croceum F 1598]|uniref:Nucleoporin Nup159/Nup146 N-terminal domain-containing protein n=1 Tax=Piloderma croceum (strain F 1598) TaxID=765440 RepID=A0A0C3FL81_PILCF|nr:hypothetical protein PILCRDRAFT_817577 [Piloderma croceum F 1598]